jgi:hypothetical protein
VFHGEISKYASLIQCLYFAYSVRITMCDFMGVQGDLTIDFSDLADGVWVMEGENGAGKSTVLEAITWCQVSSFFYDSSELAQVWRVSSK